MYRTCICLAYTRRFQCPSPGRGKYNILRCVGPLRFACFSPPLRAWSGQGSRAVPSGAFRRWDSASGRLLAEILRLLPVYFQLHKSFFIHTRVNRRSSGACSESDRTNSARSRHASPAISWRTPRAAQLLAAEFACRSCSLRGAGRERRRQSSEREIWRRLSASRGGTGSHNCRRR